MPFSHQPLKSVLNHTLWFLPSVASCHAMKNLLTERQNTFFSDFNIVVAAGSKAGIGIDVVSNTKVDMIKEGIIDPVLVTKTALKNAVSVANTIFSADCVINNIRVNESN